MILMAKDLERALSKLRFDDQVLGYSLMTKVGRPFVSFAFPDELFPRVKDSISLYKTDLRLMTIDTDRGLVVLSPVDENWILTVLYVPELQLGLAIAKTKNVLRLLEGIELPPPPEEFEESSESNLQVLESIAIQAASVESPAVPKPATTPIVEPVPESTIEKPIEETAPIEAQPELSPDDFNVQPSTVPARGSAYAAALSLDSTLYSEMKTLYRNFGFDVLMLVDGSNSVEKIADSMFQPNNRVIELLKWGASKRIIDVPQVTEEDAESAAQPSTMGRYVKCPHYDGDMSKVATNDQAIIRLCDGSRTTEQIAEELNIPVPKVVQSVAKYRKYGLKLIGKTV